MITLIEYFDLLENTQGLDVAYDEQLKLYDIMQNEDSTLFEEWQQQHSNIDWKAERHGVLVVDLWGWDMEEAMDY